MILTIAGGGSTFTAGIVLSVLKRSNTFPVTELRLYDIDEDRQNKVGVLIDYILKDKKSDVKLVLTTDKKTAFENANFIFAQFRVGKYKMREQDEKIPLKHGVVGQETCGPGGLAYGLRSIEPVMDLIDNCKEYAHEEHWILNYSNPASIVAEACRKFRPNARIINICDMPVALLEFAAEILEIPEYRDIEYKYFGLNHYGWFTELVYNGQSIMEPLKDYVLVNGFLPQKHLNAIKLNPDKVRHVAGSWLKTWDNMKKMWEMFPEFFPNSYLQYYLLSKHIVGQSNPDRTRANEVMDGREKKLFEGVENYLKTGNMDEDSYIKCEHGEFIVEVAESLCQDLRRRFLVIVENNGSIKDIPDDAMVEIPCYLTKNGPVAEHVGEVPTFHKGMLLQQIMVEKLLVEGFEQNSYQKVFESFTLSSPVPDAFVAKAILDDMIEVNKEYWPTLR